MYHITAGQIKAARALLDWSQSDLAKATGLSINTIRNLESDEMSTRSATAHVVCQRLEEAGIEFIGNEGVQKRGDEVKVIQGPNSCEIFYDDILQDLKKENSDLVALVRSHDMLAHSFGETSSDKISPLEKLSGIASVKCLLSEMPNSKFMTSLVQFRTTSKQNISPSPCFIYGNKYVVVALEEGSPPIFVVFKSTDATHAYRKHFFSIWDNAPPLLIQVNTKEQRVNA